MEIVNEEFSKSNEQIYLELIKEKYVGGYKVITGDNGQEILAVKDPRSSKGPPVYYWDALITPSGVYATRPDVMNPDATTSSVYVSPEEYIEKHGLQEFLKAVQKVERRNDSKLKDETSGKSCYIDKFDVMDRNDRESLKSMLETAQSESQKNKTTADSNRLSLDTV